MRITLLLLFTLAAFTSAQAQISYGGEPYLWNNKDLSAFDVSFERMPNIDKAQLAEQDAVTDQYKEAPYRFGVEREVNIGIENDGTWTTLDNGDRIWRYGIECPEATSISLTFDTYQLPKGARLFIWNADRSKFLGSYTHKNNKEWGSFAVGLLHGDHAVVEYFEPAEVSGQGQLHIGQVIHGYRSILPAYEAAVEAERGPFGSSGACNINVNCDEAALWQTEKRGVALIVSGGFAVCSGTLVNNTAQDGTPYFLTANHCLGGEDNWVFYFNHEHEDCSGSSGPTDQSISGSELKASNGGSDFALLELSEVPPADFNVQYCGWDNTDEEDVVFAVGIHHPSGDVKKICFEDDAPYHANQGGAAVWYIDEWELGVTEGGSSGSALFDQNHRIIGQLYGGFAACSGTVNNGQADWYGRFGVSWDGNSASSRLRDWLDPGNTGIAFIDGWPEGAVVYDNDAGVNSLAGIGDVVCGNEVTPTVNIVNGGIETLTEATVYYQLNAGPIESINWTGSLEQYDSETISLPTLTVDEGTNDLLVWVEDPNGVADENAFNDQTTVTFVAFAGPTVEFTMSIVLDDYGSETTWEVTQNGNIIYSGGPYSDGQDQTVEETALCLAEGCYEFTIYDSWGDGICCEFGEGAYLMYNDQGQVLFTGGQFEASESADFCTDDVNVGENGSLTTMEVYPNPVSNELNVILPANLETPLIQLFDISGKLVQTWSAANQSQMQRLDVAGLANGWYTLSVQHAEGRLTQKIVIQH